MIPTVQIYRVVFADGTSVRIAAGSQWEAKNKAKQVSNLTVVKTVPEKDETWHS